MMPAERDMEPSDNQWFVLEVFGPGHIAESAADLCRKHGCEAALPHVIDQAQTGLTAYFRADAWTRFQSALEDFVKRLHETLEAPPPVVSRSLRAKDENWTVLWKNGLEPLFIGKSFVVAPPWIAPAAPGRRVITIEPGEAFGTGVHQTTRGCVALLEDAAAELDRAGRRFTLLDVGCGSGIIAIAGTKLGADRALGIDKSRAAIACAKTNAILNKAAQAVRFEGRSLGDADGRWDIVAANLDPLTLKEGADRLVSLCRKFLIISGVRAEHWASTRKLFEERGLTTRREITESTWGCGLFADE
jgi:ribosomal protein L11 methyltransferase